MNSQFDDVSRAVGRAGQAARSDQATAASVTRSPSGCDLAGAGALSAAVARSARASRIASRKTGTSRGPALTAAPMGIRTTAGIGSATWSRRYAWDESHGAAGRWRSGAGLIPALIATLKVGPIRPGHRGFVTRLTKRGRRGPRQGSSAGRVSGERSGPPRQPRRTRTTRRVRPDGRRRAVMPRWPGRLGPRASRRGKPAPRAVLR
jgi:hypothetical protein